MVEEVAWAAEGYEAGDDGADDEEAGDSGADEEEAVMRRACGDGEDKEEAGKDGADEEEADDCGDEEEMQTEAEGIVAWHGRRQCVRRRERWPLF